MGLIHRTIHDSRWAMSRTAVFAGIVFALSTLVSLRAEDKPGGIIIPKDHKAVSIRVDPSDPAAGFILPGSRVDVIQSRKLDNGKVESKIIQTNLLVLAVDQQVEKGHPQKV